MEGKQRKCKNGEIRLFSEIGEMYQFCGNKGESCRKWLMSQMFLDCESCSEANEAEGEMHRFLWGWTPLTLAYVQDLVKVRL